MKINTFTLKMIAVLSMLIDHIGYMFFPEMIGFRIIGRIAFPIFAYTLVEGFVYTHDLKKYIMRMGMLAFISEIPFDLATTGKILEFGHQNVFFTLTIGLIMLYFFIKPSNKVEKYGMVILLFLISELLHTDYSSMGLLMILCFYLYREKPQARMMSVFAVNMILMGGLQMYGAAAIVPISMHNREQGPRAKGFFYAFYPAHLLVLFLIKMIL